MDYREHPLGRLLSLDILRRFQCPAWAEYLSAKIGVRWGCNMFFFFPSVLGCSRRRCGCKGKCNVSEASKRGARSRVRPWDFAQNDTKHLPPWKFTGIASYYGRRPWLPCTCLCFFLFFVPGPDWLTAQTGRQKKHGNSCSQMGHQMSSVRQKPTQTVVDLPIWQWPCMTSFAWPSLAKKKSEAKFGYTFWWAAGQAAYSIWRLL